MLQQQNCIWSPSDPQSCSIKKAAVGLSVLCEWSHVRGPCTPLDKVPLSEHHTAAQHEGQVLSHTELPPTGILACNLPVKGAGQAPPIMSRDGLSQLSGDGARRDGIAGATLGDASQGESAQLLLQRRCAHTLRPSLQAASRLLGLHRGSALHVAGVLQLQVSRRGHVNGGPGPQELTTPPQFLYPADSLPLRIYRIVQQSVTSMLSDVIWRCRQDAQCAVQYQRSH